MIGSMKRLWKDRRGNALAIAAAALPLLIGCAGLAADTIQWTLWKRELQRAADSAALAGVYDRVATGTTTGTNAVVDHDLTINHHTGIALVTGYPQVRYGRGTSGSVRRKTNTDAVARPMKISTAKIT